MYHYRGSVHTKRSKSCNSTVTRSHPTEPSIYIYVCPLALLRMSTESSSLEFHSTSAEKECDIWALWITSLWANHTSRRTRLILLLLEVYFLDCSYLPLSFTEPPKHSKGAQLTTKVQQWPHLLFARQYTKSTSGATSVVNANFGVERTRSTVPTVAWGQEGFVTLWLPKWAESFACGKLSFEIHNHFKCLQWKWVHSVSINDTACTDIDESLLVVLLVCRYPEVKC